MKLTIVETDWPARIRSRAEAFWSRVDKSGPVAREGLSACWLWAGVVDRDGYGIFSVEGPSRTTRRKFRAHRVAVLLFKGELADDKVAMHLCDTPTCVNPDHIAVGTHADNRADCIAKGRARGGRAHGTLTGDNNPSRRRPECLPRGRANGRARFTEDDVRRLRAKHAEGVSCRELANRIGCHASTIHLIVARKTWRHVP